MGRPYIYCCAALSLALPAKRYSTVLLYWEPNNTCSVVRVMESECRRNYKARTTKGMRGKLVILIRTLVAALSRSRGEGAPNKRHKKPGDVSRPSPKAKVDGQNKPMEWKPDSNTNEILPKKMNSSSQVTMRYLDYIDCLLILKITELLCELQGSAVVHNKRSISQVQAMSRRVGFFNFKKSSGGLACETACL